MKCIKKSLVVAFLKLLFVGKFINAAIDNGRKPYIVYMGELPAASDRLLVLDQDHHRLLSDTIGDESLAREVKIYSYGKSFNAFVARLLPREANKLAELESVVSVFPNKINHLHTTRSWDFLGMPLNVKRNALVESNLIVGLLDTGIMPNSWSFNDKGFGPPPSRWKGKCEKGVNFTGCNNKVIGATYYNLGSDDDLGSPLTPADNEGHGTHTSSTAAGAIIPGASFYGIAGGTARGGVPAARVAMYKVCWSDACSDMDLLAGFDAAIADGVDVLSVSIGGRSRGFFEDPIAIGAFHAMKKNIPTVCSGGNSGPSTYTVENVAPWLITVAATSTDRQIMTAVKLGSGSLISGLSLNTFYPKKQIYLLTSGAKADNISRPYGDASSCDIGSLSQTMVKGKIVYCLGSGAQDATIKKIGGAGLIMSAESKEENASPYIIPAALVKATDGLKIDQYINSTRTPTAVIYKSTTVNVPGPFVASFSSRGPQMISQHILKPDIAAPGLNILAAYTPLVSLSGYSDDMGFVKYNILSGTSMACPHVSAAAIYIKSFHPNWSPAAIKSALMTTATPMKIKQVEAELGSGSGQINPRKAINPGLIYDINESLYIRFLCKEGYNTSTITLLTGDNLYKCSSLKHALGSDGLNYPSMQLYLMYPSYNINAVFKRTVTNVGHANSVYTVKVNPPKGLNITVVPSTLSFSRKLEKKSFKVVLRGKFIEDNGWLLSSMLEWSDGRHRVSSPVVVFRSFGDWD